MKKFRGWIPMLLLLVGVITSPVYAQEAPDLTIVSVESVQILEDNTTISIEVVVANISEEMPVSKSLLEVYVLPTEQKIGAISIPALEPSEKTVQVIQTVIPDEVRGQVGGLLLIVDPNEAVLDRERDNNVFVVEEFRFPETGAFTISDIAPNLFQVGVRYELSIVGEGFDPGIEVLIESEAGSVQPGPLDYLNSGEVILNIETVLVADSDVWFIQAINPDGRVTEREFKVSVVRLAQPPDERIFPIIAAVTPTRLPMDSEIQFEILGEGFMEGAAVEVVSKFFEMHEIRRMSDLKFVITGVVLPDAESETWGLRVINPNEAAAEHRVQIGYDNLEDALRIDSVTPLSVEASTVAKLEVAGIGFRRDTKIIVQQESRQISLNGYQFQNERQITIQLNVPEAEQRVVPVSISVQNPDGGRYTFVVDLAIQASASAQSARTPTPVVLAGNGSDFEFNVPIILAIFFASVLVLGGVTFVLNKLTVKIPERTKPNREDPSDDCSKKNKEWDKLTNVTLRPGDWTVTDLKGIFLDDSGTQVWSALAAEGVVTALNRAVCKKQAASDSYEEVFKQALGLLVAEIAKWHTSQGLSYKIVLEAELDGGEAEGEFEKSICVKGKWHIDVNASFTATLTFLDYEFGVLPPVVVDITMDDYRVHMATLLKPVLQKLIDDIA